MIAFTTPTGKVGSAILALARERSVPVRALGRPGSIADPAVEHPFDFDDRASFGPALDGVSTLILIAPSTPSQAEREIAVIDAARAVGVGHIVKLSVTGAEPGGITFANLHQQVERYLRASTLPATFLRPTFFMQNAFSLAEPLSQGIYPAPYADAKIGQIDTRDIAAVALAVASDPAAHAGVAYDLTGPAAYTGVEIAAALSHAGGREITYTDVPEEAFRASMLAAGADAWTAQGLVELYQIVRAGYTAAISGDVQRVTGHEPRSFATFARDNVDALFATSRSAHR